MSDEKVFLNEGNMFVSISRVMLAGTTYSTGNITSVSKRTKPAQRGCAIVLIAVGALFVLVALAGFADSFLTGIVALLIAGAILGAGILWFKSLKPTHLVIFASASGESKALNSKDEALIDRVVSAVNDAIVARG